MRAHEVRRTISNLNEVHGVLVVPELQRVFATATGNNQLVTIDENTGAVLGRSPTGNYPDGLAYDARRGAVWTTNKTGGSETVIERGQWCRARHRRVGRRGRQRRLRSGSGPDGGGGGRRR